MPWDEKCDESMTVTFGNCKIDVDNKHTHLASMHGGLAS